MHRHLNDTNICIFMALGTSPKIKFCFRLTRSSAAGTPKCLVVTAVHETLPLSLLQPPPLLHCPLWLLSNTKHPLPYPLLLSPQAWEAVFKQGQIPYQLTSTSRASWHLMLPNQMKMLINSILKAKNILAFFTKWLMSQKISQWN